MSLMQRLWQGKNEVKAMITSGIDRTGLFVADKICAHRGANGTTLAVYNGKRNYCPSSMTCKHVPFSQKSVGELASTFRKLKKDN